MKQSRASSIFKSQQSGGANSDEDFEADDAVRRRAADSSTTKGMSFITTYIYETVQLINS